MNSQGTDAYQPPVYAAANPPEFLIASVMPYMVRGDWVKKNQSSSYDAKMTGGEPCNGIPWQAQQLWAVLEIIPIMPIICGIEHLDQDEIEVLAERNGWHARVHACHL